MRARLKPALYFVGLILAAVGGFSVDRISRPPTAPSSQPAEEVADIPVKTTAVRRGDILQTVEAYGIVQSQLSENASISAPFESTVKSVAVAVGQSVEAQTRLIEIVASPDALLQLRQANDSVDAAQRNLNQVQKRLASQLATNSDQATAQQTLQTAQTQLESLEKRGVGADRTLTAPAAGIIASISVQPGQVVASGASLLTIASSRAHTVKLGVEPIDAAKLHEGMRVAIHPLSAGDDASNIAGTIRFVAAPLNPASRLRDVFVSIPAEADLPENSFVIGEIETDRTNGLIVPRTAAHFDNGNWIIFTVKDDKAARHTVKLGLANATNNLIIADDVHEGDQVVFQNNGDLDDGTAVSIKSDDSTTAPATQTSPTSTTAPEHP